MFNFGSANAEQKKAITTVDGPVLIIAGPGTGKTYTLVQRAIYLVQERGVKPEEILMATFTEKAAKELITRITNALAERNISVNVNKMYIGTFHSICLRIIKEHLEETEIHRNYQLLDGFSQIYTVYQNYRGFKDLEGIELVTPKRGKWAKSERICTYVNNLSEELVDKEKLVNDENPSIAALGRILTAYQEMLQKENLIDFAAIQTQCYKLLEIPSILSELQNQIHYLMIDEYQDTNYIQEQIVFLLGGKHQNICVVGDDDQGLYRFRGATIRNILEFPNKFDAGKCKIVSLVTNYRSNVDIVNFYNKWMSKPVGFEWRDFRYNKTIESSKNPINSPAVIKLVGKNNKNQWYENILSFIRKLRESGKISNYNQLAFLFSSVKNEHVIALADFLESNGIKVYSPRSGMYFKRDEIKLTIGLLMLMFPTYQKDLEAGSFSYILSQGNFRSGLKISPEQYYITCLTMAKEFIKKSENSDLKDFILQRRKEHNDLKETTDYGYSGLLYQLFNFSPYKDLLCADLAANVADIRPTRNIAIFTQHLREFETHNGIDVLDGTIPPKNRKGQRRIDANTLLLFNEYLRLLVKEGLSEYEDDAEYAPSECVSFLTIHQSKGMEFPIVFVGSLGKFPKGPGEDFQKLMDEVEKKYFHRRAFEPSSEIKFFDFWRLYYTAFSRAQDLLILTCNEIEGTGRTPSKYFSEVYKGLSSSDSNTFNLNDFNFKSVKKSDLKDTFSFTSHISVYETCALQYKFYKELEFMPVRQAGMMFGSLVHETIEDIHKKVLKGQMDQITEANISLWFDNNYASLAKAEHTYLGPKQKQKAFNQVLQYVKSESDKWSAIKEAEVDVSLVKDEYIIEGKVDLIKGENGALELIDFKSEKKKNIDEGSERYARYCRQLQIYAHLVNKQSKRPINRMYLYFIESEPEEGDPKISIEYKQQDIEKTMNSFDETVHKIKRKDFSHCADNQKVCTNCDFRYFCNKVKLRVK